MFRIQMQQTQQKKINKGFTLVELMVAMSLLSVVLIAVYNLFFLVQKNYNDTDAYSKAAQQAKAVILSMDSEIRQARKSTIASGDPPVLVISPTTIINVTIGSVSYPQTYKGRYLGIYTYDTSMTKPTLVIYRLNTVGSVNQLERGTVESGSTSYPYSYSYGSPPSSWTVTNWKVIVSKVLNTDIFEVEVLKPDISTNYRRQVTVRLVVDDTAYPLASPVEIKDTLTSRSIGLAD